AGIHVSLDMDAVDPLEAPGVGTPWPGGLTFREAHLAMELLADAGQVSSMEVVEVNPIHDHENRTAKLAADLILSALGRTIAWAAPAALSTRSTRDSAPRGMPQLRLTAAPRLLCEGQRKERIF